MSLQIYKIREYDHRAETEQFDAVCRVLADMADGEEWLLTGNYNINGVELDALLLTPEGVTILEFKNWGGEITARENGTWTSGNRVIAGGSMGKNPYMQARTNRSRVTAALNHFLGRELTGKVRSLVVFWQDAIIRNELPPSVQAWLKVCTMQDFAENLTAMGQKEFVFTRQELLAIPCRLGIEMFGCRKGGERMQDVRKATMGYVPDHAPELFAELERLLAVDGEIRRKYYSLREIFRRVVDQGIADKQLNFVGLFAKLDYLMKENEVPQKVSMLVHDTRKVLNAIGRTRDGELRESLPHDVKATALLVSFLSGKAAIPDSLKGRFPHEDRQKNWGEFEERQLRCLVQSWDEEFIYVTEESHGGELKVCYGAQNRYLTREGKGDWSYLRDILWKDAQLNLVRLRWDEDICMPELIIFEPDCLISVTTIANCFESYAESPFVNLINKIKPQESTGPMLLGNLSGQLLSDTVHQREVAFEESYLDFLHRNAIDMATNGDLWNEADVGRFKSEALAQKKNISKLIGHDLPGVVGGYDRSAVVLEPSFFSEVLGIQGRFDFLLDHGGKTIIIEQKSGKGGFVPYNSPGYSASRPVPQEKHWVQLILYRALFIYEFNKYNTDLRHVMLLYSKYPEGLLSTAQSPELLLRAIRMRNLLAWCEYLYARDGMQLLETLTPEQLNRKQVKGKLWDDYKRPELLGVLSPIQSASALERSYYFRFLRFVQKEQLLSKIGNKTKEDSGFAAIWQDSLEDKKAKGNIYDELSIESYVYEEEAVKGVRLRFAQAQSTDTSNFRKGDIVILYPYRRGGAPDACAQMVMRASIVDITAERVELVLNNAQANVAVFRESEDVLWAMEHDQFDSSNRALFGALHVFLTGCRDRRELVLAQREPKVDRTLSIKGEYGAFNELVTRAKQARDYFLVIGPPGTGKTSYGMLYQLQEELLEESHCVLLLSFTNRAVDEICSKLAEPGVDIDFIRIGSELSCDERFHSHLFSERVKACRNAKEIRDMLARCRVICATTSTMTAHPELFKVKAFDLAIIDEASQILEPHLIGLLCARHGEENAIRRFVFIGDHKQLPAVVQQSGEESRVSEPDLRAIHLTDCRLSLFERLLKLCRTERGYDERFVYMLTRQGRMHREIADFPNQAFYGGRLDVVPLKHQEEKLVPVETTNGIRRLLTSYRMVFLASRVPQDSISPKTNVNEAEMIAATVAEIHHLAGDGFDRDRTVGVIVPYRNQIATVRNIIDRYGIPELHDITIDTVERYQGSQRDYIIYGFTVQQRHQLNFLTNNVFEDEEGQVVDRKLNVALTRARKCLLLIGNPGLLQLNYTFNRLIDYARTRGCYYDVPTEKYCRGDF